MGAVSGRGERTATASRSARRCAGGRVPGRRLKRRRWQERHFRQTRLSVDLLVEEGGGYHGNGAASAPQVVVQQLGGAVLEGFGQGAEQHGELGGVELKERDQHHLRRLNTNTQSGLQGARRVGNRRAVGVKNIRRLSEKFKICQLSRTVRKKRRLINLQQSEEKTAFSKMQQNSSMWFVGSLKKKAFRFTCIVYR